MLSDCRLGLVAVSVLEFIIDLLGFVNDTAIKMNSKLCLDRISC